jgi:hypothetical protein
MSTTVATSVNIDRFGIVDSSCRFMRGHRTILQPRGIKLS